MHVRGMDFAVIAVPDIVEAQRFYRDVLALTPVDENKGWSEYDTGNMTLALVPHATVAEVGWRNATVALAVPDVEQAVEELRGRGVAIVEEPSEWNVCFMATIADPFGNRLLLHQRKDGSVG